MSESKTEAVKPEASKPEKSGRASHAAPPPVPTSLDELVMPSHPRSAVWRLFRLHADPTHKAWAWCLECSSWVPRTSGSTSGMRQHLRIRHKHDEMKKKERGEKGGGGGGGGANTRDSDPSDEDDEDDDADDGAMDTASAPFISRSSLSPSVPPGMQPLASSSAPSSSAFAASLLLPTLPPLPPPPSSSSSSSSAFSASLPPSTQSTLDRLLASLYMDCDLSIHIVVHPTFRALLRELNPRYQIPTRSELARTMEQVEQEQSKLNSSRKAAKRRRLTQPLPQLPELPQQTSSQAPQLPTRSEGRQSEG